jgi:hypothetical protein
MGRWKRSASTVQAEALRALADAKVARAAAAAEAARTQAQDHQDFIERAAKAHALQKAARKAREAGAAPVAPTEPVEDDAAPKEIMLLSDPDSEEEADSEDGGNDLPSIDTETAVKRELVEWLTSNHPAHGEDDPIVLMREKRAHLVELVEGALASPHQPQ